VFAAFGLFMGFLLPSENVMQMLGPMLAILAMGGGLFMPLQNFSPLMRRIAMVSPAYGVGVISRAPLIGGLSAAAIASVVTWTTFFGVGAAVLFRRDTERV
jgi:ABC-2 type transport system permease protein